MIDLSKALLIPGHMGDDEMRWLAEQASTRKRVVEIGCYKGKSTTALCLGAAECGGHVWAVDHFRGGRVLADEFVGKDPDWLWKEFCKNTDKYENIIPLKMSSLDAAAHVSQFGKAKMDMIFIDASHDYADVWADILAWQPLVASGGLLCGHDFQPSWAGVIRAVTELLPGFKLVGGNTSIWYVNL